MNTSIRAKIYTAISCIVVTAGLCTTLATSAAAEDAPKKIVRFKDLDITTPEGAQTLYGRIRAAARDVCEMSAGGDPFLRLGVQGCIEKAITNAVKDVNAPLLTKLRFGSTDVRLASK